MQRETIDPKELKGKPGDPEGSMMISVYNKRTKKRREQAFKRKKLMNRTGLFTGVDGQRHEGVIIAFNQEDGEPLVYSEDGVEPVENGCDFVLIEG